MAFFGIELTVAGIVTLLLKAIIAFLVITLADKIIGHEFNPGHTAIIALLALFATPIVTSLFEQYYSVSIPFLGLAVSLVVWVISGEILLGEGNWEEKLKVIVVAYVAFTLISFGLEAPLQNFVTTYVGG
ncbi:MAG: hypothetical protein HYW26_03275 [Candidatus Aenigmarchaeota archaeon]|nr:hypothetical protein [Candidatus Aenigmarchaeota archaeon]